MDLGFFIPAVLVLGSLGAWMATVLLALYNTELQRGQVQLESEVSLAIAAQQAIAAIQSRLPRASAGQVSLAESESGQLSLTQGTAAGRVSIAER
jgi:hypothetical protein